MIILIIGKKSIVFENTLGMIVILENRVVVYDRRPETILIYKRHIYNNRSPKAGNMSSVYDWFNKRYRWYKIKKSDILITVIRIV